MSLKAGNVTFRHDELELPVRATTEEPNGGPTKTAKASARNRIQNFRHAVHGSQRGLLTTWLLAAMVSGAVSLALGSRLQGAPSAAGAPSAFSSHQGRNLADIGSRAPAAESETPTVIPVPEARRWDSHVAQSRGDLAQSGTGFERVVSPTEQQAAQARAAVGTSISPGRPLTAASGGLGARAKLTSRTSVLDGPIAPPED